MHNSEDVAAVRSRLVKMPGVSAVSVDLRKMQAEITSIKIIGALALRNALGNVDYGLSGLTTSLIPGPFGVRDDEKDESIPPI